MIAAEYTAHVLGLDYPTLWFLVLGAVLSGYAILDGFDLGAGALHLFLRKERSRRIALNAVGPVWDGNEVWLVIAGGVLFAGFPGYYATLLSALYIPVFLLLAALIFRAVAIEFRSKESMNWWRRGWDTVYWAASCIIALAIGAVMGAVLEGMPVEEGGDVFGGSARILRPFPLLVAFTTLSLFLVHGALYLIMKTEDRIQERFVRLLAPSQIFLLLMLIATSLYVFLELPRLTDRITDSPALGLIPILAIASLAGSWISARKKRYAMAFALSCALVSMLFVLVAVELYPVLLPSTLDPQYDLTIYNTASSQRSLGYMLTCAAIGIPLVGMYTFLVYRTFWGKVFLDDQSY